MRIFAFLVLSKIFHLWKFALTIALAAIGLFCDNEKHCYLRTQTFSSAMHMSGFYPGIGNEQKTFARQMVVPAAQLAGFTDLGICILCLSEWDNRLCQPGNHVVG